jgi:cell division protein FtsB
MREFKKRRSDRQEVLHFILGVGGLLILLGVAMVAVRAAWGMYGKFTEAATSDAIAQQQLNALKAQESQVNMAFTSLSTARGVEAQVRERYGVVKPGEGVIAIIESTSTVLKSPTPPPNLLVRLWQALFGWL